MFSKKRKSSGGVIVVVFIGGIHGVGKTYFCNQINKKYQLPVYSASNLISKAKKEMFKKDKLIADIDGNQDYLITAVKELDLSKGRCLLDGHFCLLNEHGEAERIPIETFKKLPIEAIIVLYDNVEKIVDRLKMRDGTIYDFDLIQMFQNEELIYSEEIARTLKTNLIKVNNSWSIEEKTSSIDFIFDHH